MANPSSSSEYMKNFQNILSADHEPIMTKPYRPKVAFKLENYLNPKSLKEYVIRSEKIKNIIDFYAQKQSCRPSEIQKEIKNILDEIGLDRNLAVIRWCGMTITAIGKRICSGIYVNETNVASVKEGLGHNPVLYLPTHRSYMDFILMSYICFHYDIEIPGIAAGMDFHSMFGMGTMLRKTGAFFMRRSFSNDELYWDVFREYIYALVAAYHIGVEFFIEGTRSRGFKALEPKVGLLSMALLPYFTGEVSDITIVPVSISYERLLEEQLFVYELLGVPKPKETTKGFLKAMKIIDERFGKMYFDFGQPISVREFFKQTYIERMKRSNIAGHLQKLNAEEIELVKKLANEIIFQQQRRIIITTFNLISLYYATRSYITREVAVMDEVANGVILLKGMLETLGAHVATDENCIKMEILETVEVHANTLHFRYGRLYRTSHPATHLVHDDTKKRLKAHDLLPQTMAIAVPALMLQLYINPCLFWLGRPSFLIISALYIQTHETNIFPTYYDLMSILFKRARSIHEIFKHEFLIDSTIEEKDFQWCLNFLKTHDVFNITSTSNGLTVLKSHENQCSQFILSAVVPFLCLYYQLVRTLNEMSSNEFSSKDVFISLQQRLERLMNENICSNVHPFCLALDHLNIALQSFIRRGYLVRNKENGLLRYSNANNVNSHCGILTMKTLPELEDQLLRYCNLMPFKHYYQLVDNTSLLTSKL